MSPSPSADPALPGGAPDWGARTIHELVDHILAAHHAGERACLSRLRLLAEAAMRTAGAAQPELVKVTATLAQLGEELAGHMDREEQVLFPLLLERDAEGRTGPPAWDRETELARLHREHDHAVDLLADLRILTGDYALSGDEPEEVAALYRTLSDLDADLQLHMELENRWLFSRAV